MRLKYMCKPTLNVIKIIIYSHLFFIIYYLTLHRMCPIGAEVLFLAVEKQFKLGRTMKAKLYA